MWGNGNRGGGGASRSSTETGLTRPGPHFIESTGRVEGTDQPGGENGLMPPSPDGDARGRPGAGEDNHEVLQRYLDEAARCYRERCEPLPPRPDESPEVIWMVGLPAAGKTSAAERLHGRRRIGIDDVREKLGLSFDDPGWVSEAYDVAVGRLREAVEGGESIVFDSTGLNLLARQQVLRIGEEVPCAVRSFWVDTPINVCRQRQVMKGRKRCNPFFEHCVGLLIKALRSDLPEEAFSTYHSTRGDSKPPSAGPCSTKWSSGEGDP